MRVRREVVEAVEPRAVGAVDVNNLALLGQVFHLPRVGHRVGSRSETFQNIGAYIFIDLSLLKNHPYLDTSY